MTVISSRGVIRPSPFLSTIANATRSSECVKTTAILQHWHNTIQKVYIHYLHSTHWPGVGNITTKLPSAIAPLHLNNYNCSHLSLPVLTLAALQRVLHVVNAWFSASSHVTIRLLLCGRCICYLLQQSLTTNYISVYVFHLICGSHSLG